MIDIRRDVPGLWCDDITFCSEKCDWKQCPRNQKNIRDRTVPHSFSIDIPGDCPKLLEGRRSEMTDKEKVIKGLEHCTAMYGLYECQPKDGEDCPYVDEPDCKLSIMQDALALMKEQEAEARLLTAEEVQNMEAGTAFGIETYYDHDGERMPGCAWALRTERLILSFFGTMFPDTVTKIPYNTLEMNQNTGKHEKHQYRFWSKKPTFEQCKAVKWE